ncbi:MAG: hypothetical protein ACJ790_21430 [Myxococcaceae bacterium]
MNPYSSDPRSANFTFFFQSQHCADRSAWTVVQDSQSTTGPSQELVFTVVARKAIAAARSRR